MNMVRARQISQLFFFLLFLWFCVAATLGESWWQLRGWPVNWFLQLDPLVALGTVLTTRSLYMGLLWAVVTLAITMVLGRFFCGWLCPFGALHHFVGFLVNRKKPLLEKVEGNRYHRAQSIKYGVLIALMGTAAGDWLSQPPWIDPGASTAAWTLVLCCLLGMLLLSVRRAGGDEPEARRESFRFVALCAGAWVVLGWMFSGHSLVGASLQTGLLDPIPLFYRSVNLVVLPLVDGAANQLAVGQRIYEGAWLIAGVFLIAVLLNIVVPRFYCRFVCPLGALFGVLSRNSLWRIGKKRAKCFQCESCDSHCEGACGPAETIRWNECVLCMNCVTSCRTRLMGYQTWRSKSGEEVFPDLSRRAALVSFFSGAAAVPMVRFGGVLNTNWSPHLVRPPGALAEPEFLKRCIKCGQCMRVCPTNVIHPAGLQAGIEGLWTPILNFRAGTSGCQYNCVACGYLCPTAAIRFVTPAEKHGEGSFASSGPIRMGTAFLDRGRCLPWAMDKPCIVCQENCPMSPKAIFTREHYSVVRNGRLQVNAIQSNSIQLAKGMFRAGSISTGDYYLRAANDKEGALHQVLENTESSLAIAAPPSSEKPFLEPGGWVEILILLKQPVVDPERCIGCGICEHECPVSGLRAIRVTAENESRSRKRRLLLSS